jgi:NAD(P)-dependent dehydrogenase (short-subunit alcohol dehydrogenase family)
LPYTAGKFALSGLSEGLRAELLREGIYVTTVIPGLMRTGSPPNALFKGRNEQEYLWFSIMDSLPLISMNAERAARLIVDAAEAGQAEVMLGLPAKLAVRVKGLAPGMTSDLLGTVNRLLPRPGGIGERAVHGASSESAITRSWVTKLSREAARRTNQVERQAAAAEKEN